MFMDDDGLSHRSSWYWTYSSIRFQPSSYVRELNGSERTGLVSLGLSEICYHERSVLEAIFAQGGPPKPPEFSFRTEQPKRNVGRQNQPHVDLEPDEWIKDSGSKYMTGNRKVFSIYKAYNGGNVIFGSNLRGNIIGKGMISHGSLKMANVEHVDNLGLNLLSVGQICDSKCKVIFFENDSEIVKDGKVIGRGIRKKGLYVMKLGTKPEVKICLATIDENSTLWHKRLGHANMRLIQSLASKD
ncbi:retrovirus-related pol polyprotein from transposon TNT 1-94 [Tanacetum coccineum]